MNISLGAVLRMIMGWLSCENKTKEMKNLSFKYPRVEFKFYFSFANLKLERN